HTTHRSRRHYGPSRRFCPMSPTSRPQTDMRPWQTPAATSWVGSAPPCLATPPRAQTGPCRTHPTRRTHESAAVSPTNHPAGSLIRLPGVRQDALPRVQPEGERGVHLPLKTGGEVGIGELVVELCL